MSEEALEAENLELTDDGDESGTPVEMSTEELKAEVARLRRENASKRIKTRTERDEVTKKLAEHDAWKKSQMTELERERAEKEEIRQELINSRRERHQTTAALKAKLDPDLADRIKGDTPEDMLDDARRLAKRYPAAEGSNVSRSANDMFAGVRGKPVGGDKEESESDWFRKQFTKD